MTSLSLKTLQGMVAAAVLLAAPLCAQLGPPINLQVPFGFTAGDLYYPAGNYTVHSNSTGLVEIRSADKGPGRFVMASPTGENASYGQVKLVFHRYGDQYFLSQVWPAQSTALELKQSRKEAELAAAARRPEILSATASAPGKR